MLRGPKRTMLEICIGRLSKIGIHVLNDKIFSFYTGGSSKNSTRFDGVVAILSTTEAFQHKGGTKCVAKAALSHSFLLIPTETKAEVKLQ